MGLRERKPECRVGGREEGVVEDTHSMNTLSVSYRHSFLVFVYHAN